MSKISFQFLQGYGTLIHAASASMSDLRSVLRLLVSDTAPETVKRAQSPHMDVTVRSTCEQKILLLENGKNYFDLYAHRE